MAYTYGLSPSIPAIPILYAELHKNDEVETSPLGPIVCREATLDDVDEAARLASKVFRFNPADLVHFPLSLVTDEEHVQICAVNIRRAVIQASQRCYIAVDTNNDRIQGLLRFSRMGMGDRDDGEDVPAKWQPPGANQYVHEGYDASVDVWKSALTERYGAYYLGTGLAVEPVVRNRGVAGALCSVLAEEAERTKHPVFLITTYNAVPFYERYGLLKGYEIKMCCPPVYIDKARTCGHYLFRMIKARPKREIDAPPERVRSFRSYSP